MKINELKEYVDKLVSENKGNNKVIVRIPCIWDDGVDEEVVEQCFEYDKLELNFEHDNLILDVDVWKVIK